MTASFNFGLRISDCGLGKIKARKGTRVSSKKGRLFRRPIFFLDKFFLRYGT